MFESLKGKLLFSLKSSIFSPIIWFIEEYIWSDWNLLVTILLFLFADGIALTIRGIIKNDYSITDAMNNFGLKTVSISLVVFGIGVFDSATINGNSIDVFSFVNYGFYTMLLAFMFISLLTNIYKIYPLEIIKKIIDKLTNIFE
jgi:hypothetical protein